MKAVIYFPSTGTARVFDSYNLAEATYPNNPIIANEHQVLAVLEKYNKANRKNEQTIHDWYENLFINMESTGRYKRNAAQTMMEVGNSTFDRPKYLDDHTPAQMAMAFWKLATSQTAVSKLIAPASEKKRGRPTGYTIDLVQANVALEAIKVREIKVPLQVRQMIELFTKQEFDYYTLPEMQRLSNSSAFYAAVKTTQDGWRIFRYYTPILRELGVLK